LETSPTPTPAALERVAIPIKLGMIRPSHTNPRKTFNEQRLQELAVSITEHGVLSPITVRQHPTTEGHFELVLGERRVRACDLAGIDEVPAFVEDLSDREVAERQLIENDQREDVTPLEEGAAYAALIRDHAHTVETLTVAIGKSRSHVYGRLRLTELAPAVQRLLREGKIGVALADLATRIGDAGLQERFIRECLGEMDDDVHSAIESVGIVAELVSEDGRPFPPRDAAQPLSTRAAAELLRRRYSTRLALAKFPTSDPGLTAAGSCIVCPHRSGNQPGLPGVGGRDEDLCLRPSCYTTKTQAAWSRAADEAQARGVKVVAAAAAKRVFSHDGVTVLPTSPYVDPEQDLPAGLARAGVKATWGKLLGKRAADVPRVLVQDETGAARELLDRDAAIAQLAKLGKIDAPEPPRAKASEASSPASSKRVDGGGSAGDAEEDEDYPAQAELRRKLIARLREDVITEASKGLAEKKEMAWWRWLIVCLFDGMLLAPEHPLFTIFAIDKKQGARPWAEQLVDKAKTTDRARAIVTGIMFSEAVERVDLAALNVDDAQLAILKLLGIDVAKVALEVTAAEKDARIPARKPSKGGRS